MPRKDPETGCIVMTEGEFWQHEADSEGRGRDAADLREDFYADISASMREDEDRIKNNPAEMLDAIKNYCKILVDDWNYDGCAGEKPPVPTKINSITLVNVNYNFKGSRTHVEGTAECDDGVVRNFKFTASYYDGSMHEPPDAEEWLEWG